MQETRIITKKNKIGTGNIKALEKVTEVMHWPLRILFAWLADGLAETEGFTKVIKSDMRGPLEKLINLEDIRGAMHPR